MIKFYGDMGLLLKDTPFLTYIIENSKVYKGFIFSYLMNIDLLEVEKEDLNLSLQDLNKTAGKLEDLFKDSLFSKEVLKDTINKINCEIEFVEQQLEQLDSDIKNWGFKA